LIDSLLTARKGVIRVTWLSYDVFENIMYNYYEPRGSLQDLAEKLLEAASNEDTDPDKLAAALNKSTVSRFRDQECPFPKTIIKTYRNPAAHACALDYFRRDITKNIPETRIADLLLELKKVIRSDWSIALEQRNAFIQLATRETLNEFLVETFLYIMKRENVKPDIHTSTILNSDFPLQNPHFIGYDDELEEIYDAFFNTEKVSLVQAISGLNGVGKKEIAAEYAHRAFSDYDVILWLTAETECKILTPIHEFVKRMEPEKYKLMEETHTLSSVAVTFQEWLMNNSNWLLIFNNVEDVSILNSYLPRKMNGHILITTVLSHKILEGFRNIDMKITDMDVFDKDMAVSFLLARTKSNDAKNAATVAERLGRLPLALEHAAVYIITTPDMNFIKYLALLEKQGLRVFSCHKDSVNVALQISIKKIKKNKAALQLLYLCAYFAPDNIDITLFAECPECLPDALRKEITDEYSRLEVIKQLTQYSLVKYHDQKISINRLLQEVIRDELGRHGYDYVTACLNLIQHDFLAWINGCYGEYRWYQPQNLSHGDIIIKYAKPLLADNRNGSLLMAVVYWGLGRAIIESGGRYQGEEFEWYEKAVVIFENFLGPQHFKTKRLYGYIADAYMRCENYDAALIWYKKILSHKIKTLVHDESFTFDRFWVLSAKGDKRTNEENAEYETLSETKITGIVYYDIGYVYQQKGEYTKALEWYKKVLPIYLEQWEIQRLNSGIHICEGKINDNK
jgi:tetratricopeptide (TPR) repeat protein